jgi:cardiolipin synthase
LSTALETLVILVVHGCSWLAACHALLRKRDPRSALGWTVTCLLLPAVGPAIYALFGISRAEHRANKLLNQLPVPSDESVSLHVLPPATVSPEDAALERLGECLTNQPLLPGNTVVPLIDGDEAYPAMITAMEEATQEIFLTTYLFKAGAVGDEFVDVLGRAAKRGVDVRVLIDGFGALYSLRKPWKRLPGHGVRLARFLPPGLIPKGLSVNLRNHRKILVCDNTAFTGGMNIADENTHPEGTHGVRDVHFRCRGPVVAELRNSFLRIWGYACGDAPHAFIHRHVPPEGDSLCRLVIDGLGSGTDTLNDLYCGLISAAKGVVRIMTPYFLPSHELMAALCSAGYRGVDVRVALPRKNNLPYVHWGMLRLLPQLLKAGVRVWLQPGPFVHTKLLTIDGGYSQVGSANLDPRSLRLNFELNMEVFDRPLHDRLAAHIDDAISRSQEITPRYLERQSMPQRLRNAACWIFSPYL